MKKPVILMLHLVVQWLYLASAQSNYPLVTFSTDWVTPEKYNSFIASVRAALVKTTKEKSNGIPVLISKDDPPRYLNVTLTNKAGQSISLKMDVSEAKFTDYVAGKYSCSIRTGTCFSDPFSSSVANTQRESSAAAAAAAGDGGGLGLGAATWRAKDLDEAISSLFLFAAGRATEQSFRRGVATCEMMIASAAKFRYIQRRLGAGMWDGAGNGVSDDPSLHGLLARWPTLSSQVQLSNQGAFPAPVTVDRSNGKTLRVDNVRRAVPIVSFLEHDKCGKKAASSSSSQRYLQVIRSVVQEAAAAELAACTAAEPTMHIVGAEGKCVDVPYSWYVKGTQVILWPCRSNDYDDMNQLWTLKRDGTITINGGRMCLRASSASAGDRVVIDNCWTISPREHKIWDVRADGTIALRSDGSLVLAATSTADGTGLTLERADGGGTGQAWTPTNDTAPLATAVLGYRDLYLQVDAAGAVVLAAPCGGAAAEWALYPDGSIRRGSATQQCLAPDAAGRVVATACSVAGAARQRWVFRNDGTVFNSGAGKVMNVRPRLGAQPGCVSQGVAAWEVVVSEPAPGSPTQEWVIMV